MQDYAENIQPTSQNSAERWHMSLGKKPLDFGGNPDHVSLLLGSG